METYAQWYAYLRQHGDGLHSIHEVPTNGETVKLKALHQSGQHLAGDIVTFMLIARGTGAMSSCGNVPVGTLVGRREKYGEGTESEMNVHVYYEVTNDSWKRIAMGR